MDLIMQEDLKKILTILYGEHVVKNWSMSDRMAEVLIEFLQTEKACNHLIGIVPMPYVGGRPLKYIRKDVLGRILKSLSNNQETLSCLNMSKSAFRKRFEEAGSGSY